ncbi:anti-silence-domain-containing protein [Thelephora terrestris]|uniref:Anti-silencing function protein 1 n=1 Tax=Thelephora terrestris TaxID=56493 RepID=A0A9P6L6D1_9AGAM|nr:anti-silence-domain-containing protein [Thelephora terrestris]
MSIVAIRFSSFVSATERGVSKNPARFLDPYYPRLPFECIAPLEDDLEWRLTYVSSPGNEDLDQELDDRLVGPVPVGINAFELEGCAPHPKKIPKEDVLGIAALILAGSYQEQEFVRANGKPKMAGCPIGRETSILTTKRRNERRRRSGHWSWINSSGTSTISRALLGFKLSDVLERPNLASAGAATSAAVPSADTYSADEDDEEDVKKDPDAKSNGTDKTT